MVITIYWKYSFDRHDESELAILPQKIDRSPEWRSDRIGDRLWYSFDWGRIQAEKNRPQWRSDRIGDLTGRWESTVVYPTDHVFIFFRIFIFLQIFLINISMKPEVTQTNYLFTWRTIECFPSIGPHAIALGRQSVLQVCPPVSWL